MGLCKATFESKPGLTKLFFLLWGQLRQNLVCLRVTWSSVHNIWNV